ncbi:hypothetical protein N7478_010894 [Penicillium angulare]|uniref:uncharacterized protein n=1 Tax=Penicillium angulare TaxID=116970 RepID=UPI002541BB78|nr:uncharacterized protein N7478_010894 [Penicillium angulare]KAJ5263289.1 hypothetical protein N7478_010894 [Penicillium angulare]
MNVAEYQSSRVSMGAPGIRTEEETAKRRSNLNSSEIPAAAASYQPPTNQITSARAQESLENRPISKRRRLSQSEYLGMTSHFALFKESTENLEFSLPHSSQEPNDHNLQHQSENQIQSRLQSQSLEGAEVPIESEEVRRGAHLLRLLRKVPKYELIAEAWVIGTQEGDFLGRPLVETTFSSLRGLELSSLHHDTHTHPDTEDSKLFTLSRKIFNMFTNPIPIRSSSTFDEYMASLSYRWEIVGLAFCFIGMGTVFPGAWESIAINEADLSGMSRNELGEAAMNATENCLAFCNEAGVLNDAVSWLNSLRTMLTTLVYGDRDYRSWRALGDLSTIIFSLGLNQPSSDPDIPFWLLETRKRLMGHAFSADKQLATFLGRPPRISSRFCNISLPLDLSFKELISNPEACNLAMSKLDAEGWNTVEHDPQAVWLRVCLMMGPVRENILELSLNNQVENLQGKVEQLLQHSEDVWGSLPSFLQRKDNPELLSQFPSVYLQLHLDYIYNRFLIYRILSKRLDIWSPDLVKVSIEILDEVLLLIDHRISIGKFSPELSWVMSFYGLSTAGVLSIELVRRASSLNFPIEPSDSATPFPRSRVVQSLSVFASYLQTIVQPNEGNYDICQQARETIRRVLDFVLSERTTTQAITVPNSRIPENTDLTDSILDYNYYITHLDNWQFELQDTLQMF